MRCKNALNLRMRPGLKRKKRRWYRSWFSFDIDILWLHRAGIGKGNIG